MTAKLRQVGEEVFYNDSPSVSISRGEIDFLKGHAAATARHRGRICTHGAPESSFHEMFIVHPRDAYVRPHMHLGKEESFHIIEGSVDVVIFKERGEIADIIHMGDYASGLTFYHRIGTSCYHMFLIRSDELIFHEATTGPFSREETIFAPWSPDDADRDGVDRFRRDIERMIAEIDKIRDMFPEDI